MSDLTGHTDRERRGETGRVTAFTDGVFAIIITILVLDIAVPAGLPDQSLAEAVDETWAELAAGVVSFLLTGMYWVWHRDLFNQVRVVDPGAVWLNLLFLVPVSLLPFGASVLSEYPTDAIGLRVYGTVLVVTVVMRWVLYAYLMHRAELLWSAPAATRRRVARAGARGYLRPCHALAGAAPRVSLGLYFSVPLLYFLLITVLRRRPSTRTEAEDFA
jgi:uncharacterized membrane protein